MGVMAQAFSARILWVMGQAWLHSENKNRKGFKPFSFLIISGYDLTPETNMGFFFNYW